MESYNHVLYGGIDCKIKYLTGENIIMKFIEVNSILCMVLDNNKKINLKNIITNEEFVN